MKRLASAVLVSGFVSLLVLGLSGCGGSTQSIGVALTTSGPKGIDQAQTVSITASVTNDSKSAGVQWTLSGGGTLSAQTTTAVTYNAPASVTSPFLATVTATSIADTTKSASLQIGVSPLPSITTTSLAAATAGTAYSATLSRSGGTSPFAWTVTSGTLPAGLTLNASSGAISGTPTAASSGSVTFQVTDAAGISATSQPIVFTVNPPPPLTITTASLPAGATGTAYNQTLQVTGGVPSYKWSLTGGSLPVGLSLSSAGVISGTPNAVATSNFTVTVTDSETPTAQTAQASLSITVAAAPLAVATTSSSLPQGVVNVVYLGATLQASGGIGPYSWSGTPPAGLSLSSAGVISGTPTTVGATPFTVTVTDSETPTAQTATASLTITVNAALAISTTSLPGGSVGSAYSASVSATGGVTPYSWSLSSNPSWLSINKSTGVLSGTPTTAGTTPSFAIKVTDSEENSASASLSITIAAQSCTNNSVLNGNYAMVLRGWSTSTTITAAVGSFVADGSGSISGGSLDVNDRGTGPNTGTFTGTYCVGSNNLATVTLTYGGGLTGGNTFEAALDSADSNGRIIFYDNTDFKASGVLRKQDTSAFSTAKIEGNYAFGFSGADGGGTAPRYAMAGQFNSSGSGSLSGFYDSDIYGPGVTSDETLSSTDFTVSSATTGRGTATIAFNGSNAQHNTLKFVFYVVSATELLVMEDDSAGDSLLTGQVLQQSGTFTDASLDGVSVIELESLNIGPLPTVTAGLVATNGSAGTFSESLDQNEGGTMTSPSFSGTFSTRSYGRVTLSVSGQSSTPVFYLIAANAAFVVGTDSGVSFGGMTPQSGTSFTAASLSGSYLGGGRDPVSAIVDQEVDSVNVDGKVNFTGTSDSNGGGGGPSTNKISETYTVSSSGRVVVSQGSTEAAILYIISATQFAALPAGTNAPKLIDFHQ